MSSSTSSKFRRSASPSSLSAQQQQETTTSTTTATTSGTTTAASAAAAMLLSAAGINTDLPVVTATPLLDQQQQQQQYSFWQKNSNNNQHAKTTTAKAQQRFSYSNPLSSWKLFLYRVFGPTTVHLTLEAFLWVCLILVCISTFQETYPEDAFFGVTTTTTTAAKQRQHGSNLSSQEEASMTWQLQYYVDVFSQLFWNNNNNKGSSSSSSWPAITSLFPTHYYAGDALYVFLVSVWLSRYFVFRWLALWDGGATSRRPTLQGFWSLLLRAHVSSGHTFDRPTDPDLARVRGFGDASGSGGGSSSNNEQSLMQLPDYSAAAVAWLSSSSVFYSGSTLSSLFAAIQMTLQIVFTRMIPTSIGYLLQMLKLKVWYPLTTTTSGQQQQLYQAQYNHPLQSYQHQHNPYHRPFSDFVSSGGVTTTITIATSATMEGGTMTTPTTSGGGGKGAGSGSARHRRTSSAGERVPLFGSHQPLSSMSASTAFTGGGGVASSSSSPSWFHKNPVLRMIQARLLWAVHAIVTLFQLVLAVLADYGPTLSFLLYVAMLYLYIHALYWTLFLQPKIGPASFLTAPPAQHIEYKIYQTAAARMMSATMDGSFSDSKENEPFGAYGSREPPDWIHVFIIGITSFGILSSLFFFGRILLPLPDQIAGLNAAADARRLRAMANSVSGGGGGGSGGASSSTSQPGLSSILALFFGSTYSKTLPSSVAGIKSGVGGHHGGGISAGGNTGSIAGVASGSGAGLLMAGGGSGGSLGVSSGGSASLNYQHHAGHSYYAGILDWSWAERLSPITTQNRFRLTAVVRMLRVMEAVLLCGAIPRSDYICRATRHCPSGSELLSLTRILYPASPLKKDGSTRPLTKILSLMSLSLSSVSSSSWPLGRFLSTIWSAASIAALCILVLLAQSVLLNKTYLTIMAYVTKEWELEPVNDTTTTTTVATPPVWDPRRRYKKGDTVLYPPTGKRQKVYRAVTNAPEGKPAEFSQEQELFKHELGHPWTSTALAQCSILQVALAMIQVVLFFICFFFGFQTDGMIITIMAHILAAFALVNIGRSNRKETQQLAAEISLR